AIGGFSRDFYRQLGALYGTDEAWKFEPKAAMRIFQNLLREGNVPIILDKRVNKVKKQRNQITSIQLVDTYTAHKGKQRVEAQVFLDCTYEGDLLALAGVSYTVGREDNSVYQETLNGYQLATYLRRGGRHQFPDGV